MPRLSIQTLHFIHMSDFLHKIVNNETIYFRTCMIMFTYSSIEYCHKIAEIYIYGQD